MSKYLNRVKDKRISFTNTKVKEYPIDPNTLGILLKEVNYGEVIDLIDYNNKNRKMTITRLHTINGSKKK